MKRAAAARSTRSQAAGAGSASQPQPQAGSKRKESQSTQRRLWKHRDPSELRRASCTQHGIEFRFAAAPAATNRTDGGAQCSLLTCATQLRPPRTPGAWNLAQPESADSAREGQSGSALAGQPPSDVVLQLSIHAAQQRPQHDGGGQPVALRHYNTPAARGGCQELPILPHSDVEITLAGRNPPFGS